MTSPAKGVVRHQRGPQLREWRGAIGWHWMKSRKGTGPLEGPVLVKMEFVYMRPKKHFRANGELRADAPRWKDTRPDGDKLARAVLDALSGLAFRDDAQVASQIIEKRYVQDRERPGLHIVVEQLS